MGVAPVGRQPKGQNTGCSDGFDAVEVDQHCRRTKHWGDLELHHGLMGVPGLVGDLKAATQCQKFVGWVHYHCSHYFLLLLQNLVLEIALAQLCSFGVAMLRFAHDNYVPIGLRFQYGSLAFPHTDVPGRAMPSPSHSAGCDHR